MSGGPCANCGRMIVWHVVRQAWTHEGDSWWCEPMREGYRSPRATPAKDAGAPDATSGEVGQ